MMEFLTCISSALVAVTQTITLFLLFWRHRVIAPNSFEDIPVANVVLRGEVLLFIDFCGQFSSYPTKRALTF